MITAPASPSLVQRNGASERAGEPEHNGQGVIPTGKWACRHIYCTGSGLAMVGWYGTAQGPKKREYGRSVGGGVHPPRNMAQRAHAGHASPESTYFPFVAALQTTAMGWPAFARRFDLPLSPCPLLPLWDRCYADRRSRRLEKFVPLSFSPSLACFASPGRDGKVLVFFRLFCASTALRRCLLAGRFLCLRVCALLRAGRLRLVRAGRPHCPEAYRSSAIEWFCVAESPICPSQHTCS